MKLNLIKASAIALIAAMPGAAMADSIAASLSASFGEGGFIGGGVGGEGGAGSAFGATSVSVAGAAGTWAAAGSVATAHSSGAVAGASVNGDSVPHIDVRQNAAGAYETSVYFAAPASNSRLDRIEADLLALSERVDAICDAVHNVSNFNGVEYVIDFDSYDRDVPVQVRNAFGGALNPANYDDMTISYDIALQKAQLVVQGQTVSLTCPSLT